VRGDVTTNSVEGYFSIFKRGMKGVYQHCKEKHLHRYLAEFDFHTRKITDTERTIAAVRGGEGKRLSPIINLTKPDGLHPVWLTPA